jgi:cell division protein FtsQ
VLIDDETRRRIGRRRARRALTIVAMLASVAALVGLYFSPLLRVHEVEVSGAAALNPAEIADLADAEGQSMLSADFAGAEARIRELPLVKDVQIERRWPQTLRVIVTERAPWGVWVSGGQAYVIDEDGVVLPGVTPADGAPVIHVLDGTATWAPGDRVDSDAVRLTRALLEQVPVRLALSVVTVEWSTARGLVLTTDAGYRVVIGDSENMEYKLAVWQQIEADLGREAMNGHVLDLRFGDRPSFQ